MKALVGRWGGSTLFIAVVESNELVILFLMAPAEYRHYTV